MMFKRIDVIEAKALLNKRDTVLVDIRDIGSYEGSHDPVSIHLTQENIQDFIVNTNPETSVLVMCYHGNSSQTVANYLAMQGFTEVYSIDGGYEEWKLK